MPTLYILILQMKVNLTAILSIRTEVSSLGFIHRSPPPWTRSKIISNILVGFSIG
jgi:hypothetical protein